MNIQLNESSPEDSYNKKFSKVLDDMVYRLSGISTHLKESGSVKAADLVHEALKLLHEAVQILDSGRQL